jgi:hypothetical protein
MGFIPVIGQTAAPVPADPNGPSSIAPKPLAFHPPGVSSGILPIRIGGGSRGGSTNGLALVALVPDCLVYTSVEQPTLYWYQSDIVTHPCQITVTIPKYAKPLIVLKTDAQVPAGIHAIRFPKLNAKLAPDVAYYWSVAVLMDPESHSQDIIASGLIQYKVPTPEVAAQLAASSPADKPSIYAQNGYWYDALQFLSDEIDHDPKNADLRATYASLLKQVGLDGARIESAYAVK